MMYHGTTPTTWALGAGGTGTVVAVSRMPATGMAVWGLLALGTILLVSGLLVVRWARLRRADAG